MRRDTGTWHPPTDLHRAYLRWAATQRDWGPDERRKDNGWLAAQEWLYSRRGPDRATLTGLGDDVLGTLDRPKNPAARDAGALARSAPFGLLVGWEPHLVCQLAVECAAQTHGHPEAYLAAGAYAVVVHGVARGQDIAAPSARIRPTRRAPGHEPVAAPWTRPSRPYGRGRLRRTGSRPWATRTARPPWTHWPSRCTAPRSARTYGTACGWP